MILDSAACEWYGLKIDTVPDAPSTDWEASFDEGATYLPATPIAGVIDGQTVEGLAGWLIAGPNYDGDSEPDFATAVAYTPVKVRLIDNPETVIHDAPRIETCGL